MKKVSLKELQLLRDQGQEVRSYAWAHRDKIQARPHTYTLYGPPGGVLGASEPCAKLAPTKARRLTKKTRWTEYFRYELDSAFRVIRTVHFAMGRIQSIFHHFDYEGIRYAMSYPMSKDLLTAYKLIAIAYESKKPVSYVETSSGFVFAQFYEYESEDKMMVSTYRLYPKTTPYGCTINMSAPPNAPDAPVHCHFYEEKPVYIDFASWFQAPTLDSKGDSYETG